MFFYLSKVLWFFADPGNALLFALLGGLILTATRWRGLGKWLIGLAVCAALVVTFVPVGKWMARSLEDRFPVPELPAQIDGIVVLGGVIDPVLTAARGSLEMGSAVERIVVSAELARHYPGARLIYSGGSGTISAPDQREADYVAALYADLGVVTPQLVLEREARNTAENAQYSMPLAEPKAGESWVLITSAFHMPRAVGVFRRAGWETIPYPVDFGSNPNRPYEAPMSFSTGLGSLYGSVHEWIGLFAYWLTGKTDSAFPKPRFMEAK